MEKYLEAGSTIYSVNHTHIHVYVQVIIINMETTDLPCQDEK